MASALISIYAGPGFMKAVAGVSKLVECSRENALRKTSSIVDQDL